MPSCRSWGRYPYFEQTPHPVHWAEDVPAALAEIAVLGQGGALAYGMGRSYGDSCLAESDHVLATRGMDRLLAADWSSGVVVAQAGLTFAELIRIALPRGWFPAVTPGTKHVTLGGAVANDVHGKNHHVMGTFGRHVRSLVLYRSDEGVVRCSADQGDAMPAQASSPAAEGGNMEGVPLGRPERPELFAATIGGLGLTGVILAVELQLRRVGSSEIRQRSIRFGSLDEFFELSGRHDGSHEYTVAWIDCLARGPQAGRGHYIAGDHAEDGPLAPAAGRALRMPVDPPVSLVNRLSLRAFNALYYHRQRQAEAVGRVGYEPFFYPLDGIQEWNRMYGRKGFQQYQCVVPRGQGREVMRAILAEIAASRTGSFLAVLKQCGDVPSPGLLSFPLPGVSLALDFPQRGGANERLFPRLDALVHEAGGRLYPAKDAHMAAGHFQAAYPEWPRVEALRDPRLMSRFWKRVTQ